MTLSISCRSAYQKTDFLFAGGDFSCEKFLKPRQNYEEKNLKHESVKVY